MNAGKLHKFIILGYEATILNGMIEVSVTNENDGHKIVMKLYSSILDNKIKSLRINLPNKIIFVSAKDSSHILMRAEEANNKKVMN